MSGIFDYLTWRGDLTLENSAFNEIDGVILARLSYLPFERIMEYKSMNAVKISAAAEMFLALPDIESIVLSKEDVPLLCALLESTRFRDMEIYMYVNQIDAQTQTQFSAITIRLDTNRHFVSFRGTDNTLIGWKEDFNMGFVCPVPAQKLAVEYVNKTSHLTDGPLLIGGHSKGGNLAVYAASFCDADIHDRIDAVYNYDGPGFVDEVLMAENYRNICNKVSTFVPQSSIVGMLLGHEEKYTIVHSAQAHGPWQHDVYTWEVLRNSFVYLESVNNSSKLIDYTLKAWTADLDATQREKFTDAIYTVLTETNASTLHELSASWFFSAKTVLKSLKNLDDETRRAVTQALKVLAKCAKAGVFQLFQKK